MLLKTKQNRESFREVWAWAWKGERNRVHASVHSCSSEHGWKERMKARGGLGLAEQYLLKLAL